MRYDQCDATCTTDCGHCKGNGPPRGTTDLRYRHTHHRSGTGGITHTHPHHGNVHRHNPADLIPAAPDTVAARGDYADGYRAAVAAMRILAPGLDRAQMRQHVERNIIPVHAGVKTDYEHGQSDAFAAYQSNDRRSP